MARRRRPASRSRSPPSTTRCISSREAGLLRQVVVDAARSYFDTNTGDHQHFYCEDEGALIDIPGDAIAVAGVPTPPKGMAVERVDVVVRVRRA